MYGDGCSLDLLWWLLHNAMLYTWNWYNVCQLYLDLKEKKTDKLILKFIWNCKEPKIVKTTFEKKHKNEILTLSNLLCTYGNQECMVLAHWQTYRSME